MKLKMNWNTFIASVFFVLGFSVVFSIVGVLLQSVLSSVAYEVQKWLARVGGVVIILFGVFLLGLLKIPFLQREHKLTVKRKFKSKYVASFVFGSAFAVGWTPCVGAILGAVLTLAISEPSSAFFLMLAYSLGLGIPFLVVGLFAGQAQTWINKGGKWIKYLNVFFGIVLITLGVLVFTDRLALIANLAVPQALLGLETSLGFGSSLNVGIAFLAGFVSFLSPCVLPLIPAFLAYLGSIGVEPVAAVSGTEIAKKDEDSNEAVKDEDAKDE